ncbi:MAG: hypothetical protein AAFO07_10710 [Bacteroidota bacterium]
MNKRTFIWEHQPQEKAEKYFFSGRFLVTKGVQALLSMNQIYAIYFLVKALAEQEEGLDYLQVFIHKETEQKLFFIDQLNEEMKKEHPPEHDYCTLLLAEEY